MGRFPSFARERAARKRGARLIAGVDEVGRGPLAGPVVAAAVLFDGHRAPTGIADSKMLTPQERERLFARIVASAGVAVALVSAAKIDRLNIRQASLLAMARAVAGLAQAPDHLLVDGLDCPDCPCPAEAIVGGDGACVSVAAASIVAKVVRDRLMVRLADAHPGYGFEAHKGYATADHLAALSRLGPCVVHRRSFQPVARGLLSAGV